MGYVPIYRYNTQVKISGQDITIKRYKKNQLKGFGVVKSNSALSTYTPTIKKTGKIDCEGNNIMLVHDQVNINLLMGSQVHRHNNSHNNIKEVQNNLHLMAWSKDEGYINEDQYKKLLDQSLTTSCVNVDKEEQQLQRFKKSVLRARENIFDLISANVGRWTSPNHKKKITSKFVTLTFREDITDIKIANDHFELFIKRLNYNLFKSKKAVLKYVAIPELQGKEGYERADQQVWHYHVLFFNLPLIPQSPKMALDLIRRGVLPADYDISINLHCMWQNGFTFINAIKQNSRVASYVTKYLTKGIDIKGDQITYKTEGENEGLKNLSNYALYKDLGLENMRRFQASKGLHKAVKMYMQMDRDDQSALLTMLKDRKNKYLIDLNKQKDKMKKHEYDNEYRGEIIIYNFRISNKEKLNFYELLKILSKAHKHEKQIAIPPSPIQMKSNKIDFNKLLRYKHIEKYCRQNKINFYKYLHQMQSVVC